MGERSVLLRNNRKSQRSVRHDPECSLPEASINQAKGVLTKFYIMFTEIFKELDRVHT